jgi:hypothetical protein
MASFKRLLGCILPLCFSWTFVACYWLCSRNCLESEHNRAANQTAALELCDEGDHCSIEQLRGAIPRKHSAIDLSTSSSVQTFITFTQPGDYGNSSTPIHLPLSNADPPRERLCVCRI